MGFLNTDSMPRLVEKLSDGDNIKITGNSKGNRVGTVIKKIVEKADDVTKAVEQEVVNNSHSFKVGTGNVNVSADVQDGFGEVGVKGVTYQNCLKFTNDITFNLNLENWNIKAISSDKILVKPNTVYTMIIYVSNVTVSHKELLWVGDVSGNKNSITDEIIRKNVTMGINTFKFTTNSNPEDKAIRFQGSKFVEGVLTFKPLLLEGDHTNNPNLPSYFEGIVGVGDKSKNLFKSPVTNNTIVPQTGMIDNNGTNKDWYSTVELFNLEAGQYNFNISDLVGDGYTYVYLFDDNGNYLGLNTRIDVAYRKTFTLTSSYKVRITFRGIGKNIQLERGTESTSYEPYYEGHKIEILSSGKNIFDKSTITDNSYINGNGDVISYDGWFSSDFIRVHKGEKYYIYNEKHREPFAGLYSYYYDVNKNKIEHLNLGDFELVGIKEFVSKYDGYIRISGITRHIEKGKFYANSDKTQILLDEPLMKLPNGVCDEITRDGKLIRRIGKVILVGSEPWSKANEIFYRVRLNLNAKLVPAGLCDTKPFIHYQDMDRGALGVSMVQGDVRFSGALFSSVEELKQWLQANPTTVYYELAEPIVTELPAPYLRIFKDGHLTFNTLVAPESTHVVQLNKSAQIERSIREVQGLDGRVEKLESFYDDMILETSHKLNLLNYDFDYMRNTEEEI